MDAGGAAATAHSRYADGQHLIVKEPPGGLHRRAAIRRLTFAASPSTAIWNPVQSSSPLWAQRRNSARSLGHLRERPRSDEPGREGGSRHDPNQMSHNVPPSP
jgi:hypothetical protein